MDEEPIILAAEEAAAIAADSPASEAEVMALWLGLPTALPPEDEEAVRATLSEQGFEPEPPQE